MIFPAQEDENESPRPTALFDGLASVSTANNWTSINRWVVPRVISKIETEYIALTEGAALVDLGCLPRYIIRGDQAEALLRRISTVPTADLVPGETARGLILSSDAQVVDICDVLRLTESVFMLTASRPCERRLQLASKGLDVEIEQVTSDIAALALVGPRARGIASGTGFDVTSEDVARQGSVRGVETAVRSILFGRLPSVEIVFPAAEALTIWERMNRQVQLPVAGLAAIEIIRIESGVPRTGVDFTIADAGATSDGRMPVELGLPHLAPLNRTWFNGRRHMRALREQEQRQGRKGESGTRRLVSFSVNADVVSAGASVRCKDSPVGHVTSAAFSPGLRSAICLADIERSALAGPFTIETDASRRCEAQYLLTQESELAKEFRKREKAATESFSRAV
ncbi:MAG: glycine cleavage T C-terminal barrel domain-containing protein [Pseudomonadota bacterium]